MGSDSRPSSEQRSPSIGNIGQDPEIDYLNNDPATPRQAQNLFLQPNDVSFDAQDLKRNLEAHDPLGADPDGLRVKLETIEERSNESSNEDFDNLVQEPDSLSPVRYLSKKNTSQSSGRFDFETENEDYIDLGEIGEDALRTITRKATLRSAKKQFKCLIDPENVYKKCWDYLIALVIVRFSFSSFRFMSLSWCLSNLHSTAKFPIQLGMASTLSRISYFSLTSWLRSSLLCGMEITTSLTIGKSRKTI